MFALLGRYASLIGSYRPLGTLYKGGADSCPEASATNYQLTLCNVLDSDDLKIYFERNSNCKLNEGNKSVNLKKSDNLFNLLTPNVNYSGCTALANL